MRKLLRLIMLTTVALALALPASSSAGQVYTNLYTDSKLAALNVGADGTLSPLGGSPYTVASFLQMIAVTPDARFMIGGFPFMTDNFVIPYAIGAGGELGAPGAQLNTAIDRPLVVSPSGNAFYARMDNDTVGAFSIAADGAIAPIGTSGLGSPTAITITPDGRFLFAADNDTATIQRFSIAADGTLTPLSNVPAPQLQARTMKITPNGRVMILTSDPAGTGSTTTYLVGADGSLTNTGQSIANTGTNSEHGALSPNGQFYFVPNGNEDTVSILQVGANGELTKPLPDVPVAHSGTGEAVTSTDGRFLIVLSETSEFVQTLAIGSNGALTPITPAVATGGDSDGSTPMPRPAQAPITKLKIKGAEPGQLSRFDANGSADTDGGSITGYNWNFGDGTTRTTTGPVASHRYKKAGDYDVSAAAIDNENCGGSRIFVGDLMYCNAGAEATARSKLDTPPAITKLRTKPKKYKIGKGTRVLYTLSEKARVTFTIQKPTIGRKVGRSCKKTNAKNRSRKRCVRWVKVRNGTFRVNGKRGRNAFKFNGKVKKRALGAGSYRFSVVAVDAKKGRSTAKTTKFGVK